MCIRDRYQRRVHGEHDDNQKNFDLFDVKHQYLAQAGLIGEGLPTHRTTFKHVGGATKLADGTDELKVRLESADQNGIKVAKILTFKRGSYLIDIAWEVANGSDKAIAPHAYYQLQRDDLAPAGETKMVSTFTGPAVFTDADKYQKVDFGHIADNKAKFTKTADNGWLAMVQHYFVSAWVPKEKTQREFYMRKVEGSNVFQAGVIVPVAEIAPGAKGETSVSLYAGPQLQSALKQVAPGLDLVVDYGWLTVVAAPIFWALEAIHKLVGSDREGFGGRRWRSNRRSSGSSLGLQSGRRRWGCTGDRRCSSNICRLRLVVLLPVFPQHEAGEREDQNQYQASSIHNCLQKNS
eukprot:TRINITY_DN2428_c0_g1_i3.p1 TRINITY_DN2428_c0_g1~~TRINITY_DN2428_c0_g1_i3.p1  ORF type:complete len:350 (-),score=40.30 TRINITY_DN2428_c0_g1_i3:852-1901(-)